MLTLRTIILRAFVSVFVLTLLTTNAAAWPFKTDYGYAKAVAVDADGNVFAVGSLSGPTVAIYKLRGSDGSLIWQHPFGYGAAADVAVDFNGDVIVGGEIAGILVKLSGVDGAELWTQHLFASVHDIKVDAEGNVFVAGQGGESFKVVKLDIDGYPSWIYMSPRGQSEGNPGFSIDEANAVAVGQDGNVAAAGKIGDDFVVMKIAGQSGVETARQVLDGLGGWSYFFERATAVAFDPNGEIIAAGDTSNPGQGPSDMTVVKFSSDLTTLRWLNTVDGNSHYLDHANALAVDSAGDAIVAGSLFNHYRDADGHVYWSGDQFTVVKLSGASGEVLWNEGANFSNEAEPVRGYANDVVVNRGGNVIATGLHGEMFTVVKKYALSGKNWWRHQEVNGRINGTGYGVALDRQNNVIAAGQTTSETSDIFTVVKLERLSGVPYVGTPDLVTALAPVVYLHSDDSYRPGNPDDYINNSSLNWSHAGGCADDMLADIGSIRVSRLGAGQGGLHIPYTHSPVYANSTCTHNRKAMFQASDHTRPYDEHREDDYDESNPYASLWRNSFYQREGFFLDLDDSDTSLRNGIASVPGSPIYTGAPVFYEYEPHSYITYWFFYPYDQFDNYRGLPDFPLQAHEGDWERVSIQLNCDDEPVYIFYYHHKDGMLAPWGTIDKFQGTHPIVFSAKGSHGSYPDEGAYITDACLPTGFCFEDQTNHGPAWYTWNNLSNVKSQLWYGYGGAWGQVGDGNPAVSGGDYTGPLGPSKYKTSQKTWNEEHPYPYICGP